MTNDDRDERIEGRPLLASIEERFSAALEAGDVSTVQSLLAARPDLAASRDGGVSAVMRARYRSDMAMVEALRAALPGLGTHEAAALGETDTLRQLLADGPGVQSADATGGSMNGLSADGFTARHFAASGGSAVARLLLDAGADPLAETDDGQRAADTASAKRHRDVAALLRRASGG